MQRLNHETETSAGTPSRVSEQELREILELREAQQQAAVNSNTPTAIDIAEAYDIPTDEVERLLQQVRAGQNPIAALSRKRKLKRLVAAAVTMLGLGVLFNFDFAPTSPANPAFTVESVVVKPIERGNQRFPNDNTHVDVVLRYHPSSLKRLVLGPHFDAPFGDVSVWDAKGEHVFFPVPGGGSQGVTHGEYYRIGVGHYHLGFAFPYDGMPGPGVAIQQDISIDNSSQPLRIRMDQAGQQ